MRLALAIALLTASVFGADLNVYVNGGVQMTGVDYRWTGADYVATTNLQTDFTVSIPLRPNGTPLNWERTFSTNALVQWRTVAVSNRVARYIGGLLVAQGISTNGVNIVVQKGTRR